MGDKLTSRCPPNCRRTVAVMPGVHDAVLRVQKVCGDRPGDPGVAGQGLAHTDLVGYRARPPAVPIRHVWDASVFTESMNVGVDVNARLVAAAAINESTGELF